MPTQKSGIITPAKITNLQEFPDELLLVILSYCDIASLLKLKQVSRRLNELLADDSLWKRFIPDLTVTDASQQSNEAIFLNALQDLRIKLNVNLFDPKLSTLTINQVLTENEFILLGMFLLFSSHINKIEFLQVPNPNSEYISRVLQPTIPISGTEYKDILDFCVGVGQTKFNYLRINEKQWPVLKHLLPYLSIHAVQIELSKKEDINECFSMLKKTSIKRIYLSSYNSEAFQAGDRTNLNLNKLILNTLLRTKLRQPIEISIDTTMDQDVVNALQSCLLPDFKGRVKVNGLIYALKNTTNDCFQTLLKAMKNSKLKTLRIAERKLEPHQIEQLIDALPSSLEILDLSYNYIPLETLKKLMQKLPSGVTELNLSGVGLEDASCIFEKLPDSSIKRLILDRNGMDAFSVQSLSSEPIRSNGIQDVTQLANIIKSPDCRLERLSLYESNNVKVGVRKVVKALAFNTSLRFVNLHPESGRSNLTIGNNTYIRLAEVMAGNLYICNSPMWRNNDKNSEETIKICALRNTQLCHARENIEMTKATKILDSVKQYLENARAQISEAEKINQALKEKYPSQAQKCEEHCKDLLQQIELIHSEKFQTKEHKASKIISSFFRHHHDRQMLKHRKEAREFFTLENQKAFTQKLVEEQNFEELGEFATAMQNKDYLALYRLMENHEKTMGSRLES
ncbi:MAG: F-box-like domain-containing protein [Gammaproteobacteria bacterium]